ncbi:MAG: hypothetical protein JWN34_92 [Bryobacterales bacterium]|jgi:hypothetical protein|nr:hypothetical protein [Bryobacterales bacterium]
MTATEQPARVSPQLKSEARSAIATALLLAALLLVVYACFPTRNHYWDGIGFALNIEGIGQNGYGIVKNAGDFAGIKDIYFNPNHLLFNLSGYLLYTPLKALFPTIRALDVLRSVSMVLSAATASLLFLALYRWSRDRALSFWLTLLMAFSATWWKFSTDADAYVPATFLLMLGAFLLTDPHRRPAGWILGLIHALSMLWHQIALFFLPAVVVALWLHPAIRARGDKARVQSVAAYLLTAGLAVAGAYAWVWFDVLDGTWSRAAVAAWMTENGSDVFAFRSIGANALESLRSQMRVFFGGRVKLALEFVSRPFLAGLLAMLLASLGWFVLAIRGAVIAGRTQLFTPTAITRQPGLRFVAVWSATFIAFLFVWLTEYPYYRLFYLPATVFLIGFLLRRFLAGRHALQPLRAFVVLMAVFNFAFYIYPYSKPAATPPIQVAQQASPLWREDSLILYKDFTCDNWMVRYFGPRTTWMKADMADRGGLSGLLQSARANHRQIWLDTTLLGQLDRDADMRDWLRERGTLAQPWGVVSAKHHIQFAQLTLQ